MPQEIPKQQQEDDEDDREPLLPRPPRAARRWPFIGVVAVTVLTHSRLLPPRRRHPE